jgi:2'-5' RNA ligase
MIHEPGALSYVVLDVPEPQASAVMSTRLAHADLFRAALPVEITLTESLEPYQAASEVFAVLDEIGADTLPIGASFTRAHRFPDSDTFVMRLGDEEPIRALRDRIVSTGLRFSPAQYEFVPHCTLRTRSPVSPDDAEQLLATEIPGLMELGHLSLYTLTRADQPPGVNCALRHRVQLRGVPS